MMKYTKEILEEYVKTSYSFLEVAKKLSGSVCTGGAAYITERIRHYGIDTSHFNQSAQRVGKKYDRKRAEDILILKTHGTRTKGEQLNRALQELKIPYNCKSCSVGNLYNGEELVLEIDHIDSNFLNSRLENLQYLCPNCHSQKTKKDWKIRVEENKRLKEATKVKKPKKPKKRKESKNTFENINKVRCQYNTRRVVRPTYEQLIKDVKETNFSQTGKKYGVSDNAIRKWIKHYEKQG